MHRWFFADNETTCKEVTPPSSPSERETIHSTSSNLYTDWIFKVKFDWKLCSNETLAISGNCRSLGNWDTERCLALNKNENSSFWTLTVPLSRINDVRYRYLVIALNHTGRKVVRFWETHFGARALNFTPVQDTESIESETFGIVNNELKIERGWLNPYVTAVQFLFHQAPFILNINNAQLLLQIKITPIKMKSPKRCEGNEFEIPDESTLKVLGKTFAYCEVASLQDKNGDFRKQPVYGIPCGPDHFIIFHLTLDDIEHTAYSINLYNYSPKSGPDILPNLFGYQYVLPDDLKNSKGILQLPIMCGTQHRPIGYMKCDYLVVRPMKNAQNFNLEKTFQRYWNTKSQALYVGHRGCGLSYWFQKDVLRENTIYSFNLAFKHGADMVEFDVQMTKDKVPITFHDFGLSVSDNFNKHFPENDVMHLVLTNEEIELLKSSETQIETDLVSLPISKFTLEQLRRVKVYQPPKQTNFKKICTSKINNHPFATLEEVFKEVDIKPGFVIDIKWPQITDPANRGSLMSDFDKNEFVDIILNVVLKNAGPRRIIFTSFDAEICTMLRLKQNLYPTLLLIHKYSNEIKPIDIRATFISMGIYFANAMQLLGISVNYSELLDRQGNVSDIHERNLCVFTWGVQNDAEETRKYLQTLGVDGIIFDRINHPVNFTNLKGTIFFIVPIKSPSNNIELCISESSGSL